LKKFHLSSNTSVNECTLLNSENDIFWLQSSKASKKITREVRHCSNGRLSSWLGDRLACSYIRIVIRSICVPWLDIKCASGGVCGLSHVTKSGHSAVTSMVLSSSTLLGECPRQQLTLPSYTSVQMIRSPSL
jgi:hypothetical protein